MLGVHIRNDASSGSTTLWRSSSMDSVSLLEPDPKKGLLAGMRARLAFAESIKQETIQKYSRQWTVAARSITDQSRCPKYHGLVIKPQVGLIPIGRNPDSGLWEFAHLQTTAEATDPIPERGSNRRTRGDGIDGGRARPDSRRPRSGWARSSPTRPHPVTDPNVDPEAHAGESPITRIRLDPFFMSKYEMTQGQWSQGPSERTRVASPPAHLRRRKGTDLRNPVDQVSWKDCDLWLGRLGLDLPTEAQWELRSSRRDHDSEVDRDRNRRSRKRGEHRR